MAAIVDIYGNENKYSINKVAVVTYSWVKQGVQCTVGWHNNCCINFSYLFSAFLNIKLITNRKTKLYQKNFLDHKQQNHNNVYWIPLKVRPYLMTIISVILNIDWKHTTEHSFMSDVACDNYNIAAKSIQLKNKE